MADSTGDINIEQDDLGSLSATLWRYKEAVISTIIFCVSGVLYWISLQMMTREEEKSNDIIADKS